MVDSKMVLTGQTLAYTIYCIVIILLIVWFSIKVTSKGTGTGVKPAIFYSFVGISGCSGYFIAYCYLQYYPMG